MRKITICIKCGFNNIQYSKVEPFVVEWLIFLVKLLTIINISRFNQSIKNKLAIKKRKKIFLKNPLINLFIQYSTFKKILMFKDDLCLPHFWRQSSESAKLTRAENCTQEEKFRKTTKNNFFTKGNFA